MGPARRGALDSSFFPKKPDWRYVRY